MLEQPPQPPPIIVDGHIDTPQRMLDGKVDISARLPDGHVDVPRMKAGGLSAAFFSIWVDNTYGPGTAYRRALALIGAVRALAGCLPLGDPFLRRAHAVADPALERVRVALEQEVGGPRRQQVVRENVQLARVVDL